MRISLTFQLLIFLLTQISSQQICSYVVFFITQDHCFCANCWLPDMEQKSATSSSRSRHSTATTRLSHCVGPLRLIHKFTGLQEMVALSTLTVLLFKGGQRLSFDISFKVFTESIRLIPDRVNTLSIASHNTCGLAFNNIKYYVTFAFHLKN